MNNSGKQVVDKEYLKKLFYNSSDCIVKDVDWPIGKGILCYYSSLADSVELNNQIDIIRQRASEKLSNWGKTAVSDVKPYSDDELIKAVCKGLSAVIFPESQIMLTISAQSDVSRAPAEPISEQIVRGAHDGFIENVQKNLTLVRQKLSRRDLVVKSMQVGKDTNTSITYLYIDTLADKDVVNLFESRLKEIKDENLLNTGEIEDYLEESVYSPFPQFMNTERPDRVVFNLMEGKIAIFSDHSPSVLIAPVTFFSFYQSPDDYNGRVIAGSFFDY
ncbi:spore germination protein [Sporosarcina sp. FSL W8-0480]|uniref:spore germination protein n=1 Tax=Sporosarcina sp. FSL W8-0480 TaxID=2954701 RepID=UPI0030D799C9